MDDIVEGQHHRTENVQWFLQHQIPLVAGFAQVRVAPAPLDIVGRVQTRPAMTLPRWLRRWIEGVASTDWFARVAPGIVPAADRFLDRLTGGRIMLSRPVIPSIWLVTTGARSGALRATPLAAVPLGGDHYVVASNFGRSNHPAWSYNLIANPTARMTSRHGTVTVTAHLLEPAEKDAVWPVLVKAWPPYEHYVARSGRDLRVFRLREQR